MKYKYELGTFVYGPGEFLFFGLQVIKEFDMPITIYGYEKLNSIECVLISRNRRKMVDKT